MFQANEERAPAVVSRLQSLYFPLLIFTVISLFLLFFHLEIHYLPAAAIMFGLALRIICPRHFLDFFAFLLPILPALASMENHGLPFNYLLLPLLVLVGIYLGEWVLSKKRAAGMISVLPPYYLIFLLILLVSVMFVFLRWSNLTIKGLAFFADTPVEPDHIRLSFASIFPIVEMSLYVISVLFYLYLQHGNEIQSTAISFLTGHSLSILASYWQSFHDKRLVPGMGHGLASDSTTFGFLTALCFILSWHLYHRKQKRSLGLLFFLISFIGLLNAKTRIGILAAAAVVVVFFISEKKYRKWGILFLFFLAALFFIRSTYMKQGDFVFVSRIRYSLDFMKKAVLGKKMSAADFEQFSAYRNRLWAYSFSAFRRYPLSGIGAGNFLFWTRNHYYKKDVWHDLPANQYLFIAVSTGLLGLGTFLIFCLHLLQQRPNPERWMLGLMLLLLFFGDLLWTPESFLGFWLVAGLAKSRAPSAVPEKKILLTSIIILTIYVLASVSGFNSLHPKNWAKATSTPYHYGFSYRESDGGRGFRWTGKRSGIYIYLDPHGCHNKFHLTCTAPLNMLPDHQQIVDVYWRGKLLQKVIFRKSGAYPLKIKDRKNREGFLEFRVFPVFNLKQMRLGEETRTLGIQVSDGTHAIF